MGRSGSSNASSTSSAWLTAWLPIGAAIAIGLVAYIFYDMHERVVRLESGIREMDKSIAEKATSGALDEKTKPLSDHTAAIAKLEERIKGLERVIYATKAAALGYKNPHIVEAKLQKGERWDTKILGLGGEYFIRFTIAGYIVNENRIIVTLTGNLPPGNKFIVDMFDINLNPVPRLTYLI